MLNKKLKFILIISLFVFIFSSLCYATDVLTTTNENAEATAEQETTEAETNGEETEITENDKDENMIEGDFYYANNTDYTLEQTVDGNAFIIAQNVTIKSEIGGDLFVMANTVNLEEGGNVYGNVFVLANEFRLNSTVYDIFALCKKITVEYDGVIYRDIRASAGEISISGGVGRNCYLNTDNLVIANDAAIYGNLEYSSKEAAVIPEGIIKGEIKYTESKDIENDNTKNGIVDAIVGILTKIALTLVVFGLMVWISPKFYSKLSNITISKIFVGLGIGLAALVVIPIACLIIIFTQIGITVSFALIMLYALMLIISSAIAYIAIGTLIANKLGTATKSKSMLFTIVTTVAVYLIGLIPVIGGLISFLITISGFGILITTILNKNTKNITE